MRFCRSGRRQWLVVALLLILPANLIGCSAAERDNGQNGRAFGEGVSVGLPEHMAALQGPARSLPKDLSPGPVTQSGQFTFSRGWQVLMTLERQVWAAPDGHRLCLVDHSSSDGTGVTCAAVARVLKHGITSTFLREGAHGVPADRSIVGLVPDGTARVRVLTPGYPPAVASVRRNVFVLHDQVPEPPETVELLGRG